MPHGHCSPQGPGQGAAACPHFPKEHVQDHLATTLLPLRPPLGLPAGPWLLGCWGWLVLLGSALQAPAELCRLHRGSVWTGPDLSF